MVDDKKTGLAITLILITATIVFLGRSGSVPFRTLVALAVLTVVSFLNPLIGVVVMVPIVLLAWIENYKSVLAWLYRITGKKEEIPNENG